MTQCTFINTDEAREFLKANPQASRESAMDHARCTSDVKKGYTRCEEHGAGDVISQYTRDMQEDHRERFKELYNNIIETYNVDEKNLYVCNLVAMTCREMITSQNAEGKDILKHIQNAASLGAHLTLNPKERKTLRMEVKSDAKIDAEEIIRIAEHRMSMIE